ncbi:unnamed protein product [Nyctereutes procyonoides]|uniref:PEST proteolytic signal-containing nuclear protein n=1 Tax=Nyctereutes procyonoides TaxID=34880 RepID=A0A811YAR7_NYCPR|nr:unnamed protein product [Nyctereutes procyonoides]
MADGKVGEEKPEKPCEQLKQQPADLPKKSTKISKSGFATGISLKKTVPILVSKPFSAAAEMPPEAKIKMKNTGRNTPTLHGFSDNQKLREQNIKSHLGNVHDQDKSCVLKLECGVSS